MLEKKLHFQEKNSQRNTVKTIFYKFNMINKDEMFVSFETWLTVG